MQIADEIAAILTQAGTCAMGCAPIHDVPSSQTDSLESWLAAGHNAGMAYMANYPDLRRQPARLLEGAESIISLAFSYVPASQRAPALPLIAEYAYGADYHDTLRHRLTTAIGELRTLYGGDYRICIDSAPVFERYWAEECGIGYRADNGLIAVPGHGTRIFLAEIITTLPTATISCQSAESLQSRGEVPGECRHCGACRRACPAGALQSDGRVDARRCLSYLTIEHRGPWDNTGLQAMQTPAGRHTLYGCDICQRVCPLNRTAPPTEIEEFAPSDRLLSLTAEESKCMTQENFSRIFRGSPIKRTKLAGLLRNAANLLQS